MSNRLHSRSGLTITKTCLFKYMYTENFTYKNWKFSDKISDIFHISAQNIDCGYSLELPWWGDSNEFPQSIFWAEKKNNVFPCKHQFYYIKVGFTWGQNYIGMFSWCIVGIWAMFSHLFSPWHGPFACLISFTWLYNFMLFAFICINSQTIYNTIAVIQSKNLVSQAIVL